MTGKPESDVSGSQQGLRATDIRRFFDGVHALNGVDLEVLRHEVVGLIGPNGAGKTTLVNIITGFDSPTTGSVELDAEVVTRWSAYRRGRAGLARTFQAAHSFGRLTVRENIEVGALASGGSRSAAAKRATELMGVLGLGQHADSESMVLTQGEERKLGVARALATEPKYLLMDEPAAGLNEGEVPELAELLRSVRDEHGVGVLLIDHNVPLILDVCDRIQVLDEGKTIANGSPADIRANSEVASAYLGKSAGSGASVDE